MIKNSFFGVLLLALLLGGGVVWNRQAADSERAVQQFERELQEERLQTNKQIQDLKQVNAQLSTDLERAHAEVMEYRVQAEAAQQRPGSRPKKDSAAQQVKGLKEELKQKERQVAELTQQRVSAQKRESHAQARVETLTRQVKDLEQQGQGFRKSAEDTRTAAQQMERQLAKERQQAQRQIKQLQKTLADAEQHQQRLARQVEAAQADRKQTQQLRRELTEANGRIAELIVSLDQQERLTAHLAAEGDVDATP